MFQSLLGRLKTSDTAFSGEKIMEFQSLLGRLKTPLNIPVEDNCFYSFNPS
ncbi:hypothetical protein TTE2653 [Caldanaerobacter subterraneus subsp. tengcongensis MB4]|uniref:Uncharacterized protein n=1 Tax=Caldanaerobacter subterraneus subsp. tengcongensis (strain DSM 15242 / JCM 11007 / NBRC 100824 / MB4) TaxID=273068 RepID=Q8R6Y0_CALS4|nr:hypothetical protein TTE2653 [Caldanaerobacter subterraneus subsp. tengcongensis MB4]